MITVNLGWVFFQYHTINNSIGHLNNERAFYITSIDTISDLVNKSDENMQINVLRKAFREHSQNPSEKEKHLKLKKSNKKIIICNILFKLLIYLFWKTKTGFLLYELATSLW